MTFGPTAAQGSVSRVVDTFSGTLTLDDGARVEVDLGLDGETLSLHTEGRVIGTWPLKYCRVSRSGQRGVMLSLDGEKTVFEPDDLSRFSTVAAQRFRASSLAERIGVIRDVPLPDPALDGWVGDDLSGSEGLEWARSISRWVLVALGAIGLVVVGWVGTRLWGDDSVEFAGTTVTVPLTAAARPDLFDQTIDQFTDEWNLAASAFGVPIQIRGVLVPGTFESQLTRYITMQGRTSPDGTIESLVLVIDPAGDTAEDEIALSALGVAIAVANPELDREERSAVLASMGLSVRNPDLTGLEGDVDVDDVAYSISYFPEFNALLFSINAR